MAWFAHIFQHPGQKCGTSVALRGKMGVGKTKVGEVLGTLLGVHYKPVSDPRYVTGRFNSHMVSLLLLHADEGFWAGDKKAEGKLKDLVTGKKHPIEFKGREAFWIDNHVRLLVTGNPDWIVPAGFEERRFGCSKQRSTSTSAAMPTAPRSCLGRGPTWTKPRCDPAPELGQPRQCRRQPVEGRHKEFGFSVARRVRGAVPARLRPYCGGNRARGRYPCPAFPIGSSPNRPPAPSRK
jgi:hypothetical protein